MKLSIIILVYNGEKYLPELIESLKQTNWPSGKHEVIFVDNASSDNSREIIKNEYQHSCGRRNVDNENKINLVFSEQNLGFAKGNNIGIKRAMENRSDYIVLLNQDTVVEPDWIEQLIKAAESDSAIGAVQSLLLYWKDRNIVQTWGNHIHFLGLGFCGGNLEKIINYKLQITNPREITYASGAAVLFKAEALKKVGLFDETLESYHEDLDIGLRLRLAGYKSYLAPKSIVYHKYEFLKVSNPGVTASAAKQSRVVRLLRHFIPRNDNFNYKYYLMERNRLYILLKYYKLKTLLLIFPAWLVMEIGLFMFAIVRGFWREKFKGYWWIVKNFRLIMRKRKEIQLLRHSEFSSESNEILKRVQDDTKGMSDKELTRDFVAWIDYQEIKNPALQYIGNPIMRAYWSFVRKII